MVTVDIINKPKSVHGDMTFYFSTRENKRKFDMSVMNYLINSQEKLQKYFDIFFIDPKDCFYLSLYKRIEKKIFEVEVKDKEGKTRYFISPNFTACINLINYRRINGN